MKEVLGLLFFIALLKFIWINYSSSNLKQYQQFQDIFEPVRAGENSTSNMTNQQFEFVINSIAAAERKFNSTQYNDIAKSIANSMTTVMNNSWGVFVFPKNVSDLGLGAQPYRNKSVVLFQVGNYKLNYLMVQLYSGSCSFSANFSNNSPNSRQVYGSFVRSYDIQAIKAAIASASTYAGDYVDRTATYIYQKLTKSSPGTWNTIVSLKSSTNGAYFCTNTTWAMYINYADFGWNYYIYET